MLPNPLDGVFVLERLHSRDERVEHGPDAKVAKIFSRAGIERGGWLQNGALIEESEAAMGTRCAGMILKAVLLAAGTGWAQGQAAGRAMVISQDRLCVTEGAIGSAPDNRLSVETTKMRAYVHAWTAQSIRAQFTYVGPTAEESPLGSGEVRRQFGLKLRAANACNLVYVMWRFEPESKIVVSLKRNPGETRSSECGNRGYQNIKPRQSHGTPPLRPGDKHGLAATMRGTELTVTVDGKQVWSGDVGPEASDLNGPVGIRSDNVRLMLDLEAGQIIGPHPQFLAACDSGPGVSD